MKESPIFTRTHDLLKWLLPATRKFPRQYRYRNRQAEHLLQADLALAGLRKSLLLCYELDLLSAGQYRHVSELAQEVGRLLGGWRKGQ
ncbi:MAG: hypothetical protein DCC57_08150 [Chloroflexi bacterium]|nr:MAG: hypothetical protein DCC57_08150 [Chloroflexota bacterium]